MSRFAIKSAPPPGPKPFSFSYSKLKNFETCPLKHLKVDLEKSIAEAKSPQLDEGNKAHKALAGACTGLVPLPEEYAKYQKWVDKARVGMDDMSTGMVLRVEQQLAINIHLQPVDWFARDVWFRGVVDVLKYVGEVALAIDWKTGKPIDDSVQLALFAQLIFAHHHQVEKIRTEFVWLADGYSTRDDFTRQDMVELWAALKPRVDQLIHAHATGEYPAKPGGLCRRYCPVTTCAHHGG